MEQLTEEQVRQIALQVFQEQLGKTQYNVSSVPFHTHNQTDSPRIPPTSVTNFTTLPSTESSNISGVISPSNIGISRPPFNIIYPTPIISGYAAGVYSQFNGGTAPLGSMIAFFNEGIPLAQLWVLFQTQDDLALATTAVIAIGATSATLTVNWMENSGAYLTRFSNGDARYVTYTNGANTMSWTGGLTSAATINILTTIPPVWYGVDLPNVA